MLQRYGTNVPRRVTLSAYTPRIAARQTDKPGRAFRSLALRPYSSFSSDYKTGHIQTRPGESILFFTNASPLRLGWRYGNGYLERLGFRGLLAFDPDELIRKALPDRPDIRVDKKYARAKEGGLFVTVAHNADTSNEAVEQAVVDHLKSDPIRPWWTPFRHVNTHLVLGRPWIEDLHRLPSCKLKVEFATVDSGNPELTQEQLYSVFRQYGKLLEIKSQPADSKELPKFAHVIYTDVRHAIMARNCLHGFVFTEESSGTALAKLHVSYQRSDRSGWFKDWILNHPRIVIPIFAALAATITVAIFDPIRTFYIKMHITRAFHLKENRFFGWLISGATDLITFRSYRRGSSYMEAFEENRKDNIDQLQSWLLESSDTFIVVQGPRGTGKKELVVGHALKQRGSKLVIDCKPIQEARGDSSTINAMAAQVGYRPVFSWMNSFSGLIDLAAQSATGMKTGFSETLDTQMSKILNNTTAALRQIALEYRKKDDPDSTADADAYLEAHPERRPVVVIDNFLHKSQDGSVIYEKLSDWAADLATANLAHVIFLTTDVSFSKSLSKALPGRVFRQLSLSDASPEAAKKFVMSHLDQHSHGSSESKEGDHPAEPKPRPQLKELDECIAYLGGRLTDLEFLARRIKGGETPKKAVEEIISQSASEILKMYLSPSSTGEPKWTPEQAWVLIKKLADSDAIRYNEMSLADGFSASNYEPVLQALEQAELITIVSKHGRPCAIKPGKPVYGAAFRSLTQDKVLSSRLRIAILTSQNKTEAGNIDKYEAELKLLGELPKHPGELTPRIRYLLNNVLASQVKIEKNESVIAELKKVLQSEY